VARVMALFPRLLIRLSPFVLKRPLCSWSRLVRLFVRSSINDATGASTHDKRVIMVKMHAAFYHSWELYTIVAQLIPIERCC
jgi:hypothetical protein